MITLVSPLFWDLTPKTRIQNGFGGGSSENGRIFYVTAKNLTRVYRPTARTENVLSKNLSVHRKCVLMKTYRFTKNLK